MTCIKKARFVFFLLLLSLPIGCKKEQHKQAIIILLDAARPDHFSCYGYERETTPSIDTLAKTGVVFENCFTQATYTRAALPSFLYSRYYAINIFPGHRSIPLSNPHELFRSTDDQCISFSKVLELSGFTTAVISAHSWLTNKTQFAREFTECFELPALLKFEKKYGNPRADQVIDFALEWLKRHSERDFLLYLHLMDTHFPHFFEEDAQKFFGKESYDARNFSSRGYPLDPTLDHPASDVRYLNSLYDGSLRYADREIGRLIHFLKDSGQLNDTLLIVTSDHGELLLERKSKVGHGDLWYDLLAKIPLIIHYPPKVEARRISAFSELIDVGPTLLELLDVKIPRGKTMDGKDLLGLAEVRSASREAVYARKALRTERYKCIFRDDYRTLFAEKMPSGKALSSELYNVIDDPEENTNLYSSKTEIVGKLLVQFRERMSPSFKRFVSARSREQPEFPFAISAEHFRTNLDIPKIPSSRNAKQLRTNLTHSGWIQESEWPNFGLYATGPAKPLEVSFDVPNGEYYLSADINGSCKIVINGQQKSIRSEKFRNHLRWKARNVEFGPILIEKETFSATIFPDSKERWFGLRLFGFEPVIEGKRQVLESDAEERLERLRTLGYIK